MAELVEVATALTSPSGDAHVGAGISRSSAVTPSGN
jgi:hypothetical protein